MARFCTYEKTAFAAEHSKLLGLEEVEAFLTAGATTYLRIYIVSSYLPLTHMYSVEPSRSSRRLNCTAVETGQRR